jgi:hypothetical protein
MPFQMEQWFKDNWVVAAIGFAASIVSLAAFFGKPLLSIVVSLWKRMNRKRKIRDAEQSLDLRFVPIPWRCWFGIVHRNGFPPMADLRTYWKVTNASPSGMPARLLTARLVKPRLRDARVANAPTEGTNAIVVSVDGELIPWCYTREVFIQFVLVLPSGRLNKPIRIKIVAVDQLSNEHQLPPMTLKPIIIENTDTSAPIDPRSS